MSNLIGIYLIYFCERVTQIIGRLESRTFLSYSPVTNCDYDDDSDCYWGWWWLLMMLVVIDGCDCCWGWCFAGLEGIFKGRLEFHWWQLWRQLWLLSRVFVLEDALVFPMGMWWFMPYLQKTGTSSPVVDSANYL